MFASFADVSSRSALTSVVLPELARPMMSRRRCGCVGSCVACVCQSEDEGRSARVPFSRRIARSRARVATAYVAPPRPPRRVPSSSPGRAPPAGSSTAPCVRGGGTERRRVRAARASLGRARSAALHTRARDVRFLARLAAPRRCASREKGGSCRAHSSVRADASGVSASRLAEMGGDHRGGKRHRHGVRGLRPLESAACHAAPRRSRDPALPTCPPIPPGGERASKALDRRLRRSPPRRRADVLVLSLLSLPSSRVDRMAATTAAAAAAGSVPPR